MHEQETVEIIYGVNPVKEALRAGMPIERAYTCRAQGAVLPLIGQLKSLNVPILEVDEKRMSYLCPKEEGRTPNHQGIVVPLSAAAYVEVEDILRVAAQRGEDPFVIVLDGITDPHNLGAILRSAEALGVHGVIIPKHRRGTGDKPGRHVGSAQGIRPMGGRHGGRRAGLQPGQPQRRAGALHRKRGRRPGALDRAKVRFYGGYPAKGPNGIAQRILCGVGADL